MKKRNEPKRQGKFFFGSAPRARQKERRWRRVKYSVLWQRRDRERGMVIGCVWVCVRTRHYLGKNKLSAFKAAGGTCSRLRHAWRAFWRQNSIFLIQIFLFVSQKRKWILGGFLVNILTLQFGVCGTRICSSLFFSFLFFLCGYFNFFLLTRILLVLKKNVFFHPNTWSFFFSTQQRQCDEITVFSYSRKSRFDIFFPTSIFNLLIPKVLQQNPYLRICVLVFFLSLCWIANK